MQFDYKEFLIDASPLDEGGRYYGRAKIYRRASAAGVFCGIARHDGRVDDFGAHARMEAAIIAIL